MFVRMIVKYNTIQYLLIILHCVIAKQLLTKRCLTRPASNISGQLLPNTTLECQPRIVNGYNCYIISHPYMISIRITATYTHHCGGSLISALWVLTAGHCCRRNYKPATFTAVSGLSSIGSVYNYNKMSQEQLIIRNYRQRPKSNDIGLMELDFPITESPYVKYVLLANSLHMHNRSVEDICQMGTVVGWGTQYGKDNFKEPLSTPVPPHNPNLQCVKLPVMAKRDCEKRYGYRLSRTVMCAFAPGKDACQGDSGGPLMCNKIQYGIVSSGIGCAFRKYPGLFTRVDLNEDFIRAVMARRSSGFSYLYSCNIYITLLVPGICIIE